MISTEKIEKSTYKVQGVKKGTGFFFSETRMLTCAHVLGDNPQQFIIHRLQEDNIEMRCIARCVETDLAILEVVGEFKSQVFLKMCKSTIVKEKKWAAFGHPATEDGLKVGSEVNGTIKRWIENSEETLHDVSLYVQDFTPQEKYNGYSGSAIIDESERVISVMRYKNDAYLSAVSIKKAEKFLTANGVTLEDDELDSFQRYADRMFDTMADPMKQYCVAKSGSIIAKTTPGEIISALEGNLFYPEKKKSVSKLIEEIKLNVPMSGSLWSGWLKFLTYISILNENELDFNNIILTLPGVEVATLLGNGAPTAFSSIDIDVKLNFYFTQVDQFVNISKQYITDRLINKVEMSNSCQIFNTEDQMFGIDVLSSDAKRKMVMDISGPQQASPSVMRKVEFGMLSLFQLNLRIGQSSSLADARVNLEKMFKDAIK